MDGTGCSQTIQRKAEKSTWKEGQDNVEEKATLRGELANLTWRVEKDTVERRFVLRGERKNLVKVFRGRSPCSSKLPPAFLSPFPSSFPSPAVPYVALSTQPPPPPPSGMLRCQRSPSSPFRPSCCASFSRFFLAAICFKSGKDAKSCLPSCIFAHFFVPLQAN